uniref:CTLH domain-containing protein n=1 Tax=Opuntia streptacantha TaxID=393608 RepID=A0A7C9A1X5_OPUST
MAQILQCQGQEETIGSRGLIKRIEFVRLISDALYALGYKRSGACLEEESGIPLHSADVSLLMQYVLEGNWDEGASTLHKIGLEDETIIKSAKFLILEQKFLEFLEAGKTLDALMTLRTEISPLHVRTSRVHELSSCLLSRSVNQNGLSCNGSLKAKLRSEVLDELQKLLPPTVVVPERRLEHLVEQALNLQRGTCVFHNSSDWDMSLYTDHHCGRDNIPRHTSQILEGHQDEVWNLQFSHEGKYLASASTDRSAIIWEVGKYGEATLKHRLCGHQKPVSQVSWSLDDQQLLTCGAEETVRRWDVSSGKCLQIYEKAGIPVVSCAWSPDGRSIFAGFADKSICVWDLNGNELECWKGQKTLKISDLEITGNGRKIISMCRETAILLLDRETNEEKLIEEDQMITSFSLSRDSKLLLVNLLNQEIHLWTIDGDVKLLAKYKGHKRSRFLIRSCFGGLDQSFIASGSEDSQVYIWHRGSGQLVDILPGHSGAVNCVSWNPVDPHMLASASDDRTIRIWGLHEANIKPRVLQSNGTHHCNGKI